MAKTILIIVGCFMRHTKPILFLYSSHYYRNIETGKNTEMGADISALEYKVC